MVITATFIMTGCGNSSKEKKGDTGDMKVKLEKLKKEKNDLDAEIRKLEELIAQAKQKQPSRRKSGKEGLR